MSIKNFLIVLCISAICLGCGEEEERNCTTTVECGDDKEMYCEDPVSTEFEDGTRGRRRTGAGAGCFGIRSVLLQTLCEYVGGRSCAASFYSRSGAEIEDGTRAGGRRRTGAAASHLEV